MNIAMKFAFPKNGPFVHCCGSEVSPENVFRSFEPLDVSAVFLSGCSMRSVASLISEFARGFKFPGYFGNNTDAFMDCICDLNWFNADGYVVVLEDGDQLLLDEPHEVDWFIGLMEEVGEIWNKPVEEVEKWALPSKPFHTVIKTIEGTKPKFGNVGKLVAVE